jgi:hypothetical protein
MLTQIPEDEVLNSISADGTHDTKTRHKVTADRQVVVLVFICKNVKLRAEVRTETQVKKRFKGDAGIRALY